MILNSSVKLKPETKNLTEPNQKKLNQKTSKLKSQNENLPQKIKTKISLKTEYTSHKSKSITENLGNFSLTNRFDTIYS